MAAAACPALAPTLASSWVCHFVSLPGRACACRNLPRSHSELPHAAAWPWSLSNTLHVTLSLLLRGEAEDSSIPVSVEARSIGERSAPSTLAPVLKENKQDLLVSLEP